MRIAFILFVALSSSSAVGLETQFKKTSVALTISGGVSLGSYEAGVNWALINMLRKTEADLTAVTGASAGNINTLLTAYSWCGYDDSRAPENSLFWKTWVPIGLDAMSLERFEASEGGYTEDDGLLARAAFKPAVDRLASLALKPGARKCEVNLGITLSKRATGKVLIPANTRDGLVVPAVRYVVPFKLTGGIQQPLKFSSLSEASLALFDADRLGLHLLPAPPGEEISFQDQLVDYVLAASAFPYAFGSMQLDFWAKEGGVHKKQQGVFLDGGVFDNIPIGLALRLLKVAKKDATTVFYVDPDQRRFPRAPKNGEAIPLAGIDSTLAFMNSAVKSARMQELQTVARYELAENKSAKVRLTNRTTNVFGEYYGAFAAFSDVRFREMDFYLGIFDGLASAAEWHCESLREQADERATHAGVPSAPIATLEERRSVDVACVFPKIREFQQELDLANQSPVASYVADRLVTHIYPDEARAARVLSTLPSKERCEHSLKPIEVELMADVLTAAEHEDFLPLLAALKSAGAAKHHEWDGDIFEDTAGFASEYAGRLLARALALERTTGNEHAVRAFSAASLVARSMRAQKGFEWDPSAVPDDFGTVGAMTAHLMPYYLGGEFMTSNEFGVRALWRPALSLSPRWRLIAPAGIGWFGKSIGVHSSVGVGLKFMIHPPSGWSVDASASYGLWGRRIGSDAITPAALYNASEASGNAGFAFFESLRLGYSYFPATRAHSVSVGVINFNGIAYWLMRTARGI